MNPTTKRCLQIGLGLLLLALLIGGLNNGLSQKRLDKLARQFTEQLEASDFEEASERLEKMQKVSLYGSGAKAKKEERLTKLSEELDSAHDGYYKKLSEELITEAEEKASWYQFDQADQVRKDQLEQITFRNPEATRSFTGRLAYLDERIDTFRERKSKIETEAATQTVVAPDFIDVWKRIRPRLNQADELLVKIETAPKSALIRTDQKDLTKDINKILDQIGEQVFEGSPLTDQKNRYQELQRTIAKKRDRISAIREQIQEAPEEALFAKTREQLEAESERLNQEIKSLNKNLPEISKEMRDYLRRLGMDLSEEQVSIFFNRVDADELIGLMAIFQVLRPMHDQLAQLIQDNQDNLDYARKYYGMHLSLLQMIERFQTAYIERIDKVHLPALMELNEEAAETLEVARENLDLENGSDRRTGYEANIKSLQLTLQSVDLYKDVLIRQQKTVELARRKITRDIALAENTYKTVTISSNLLDLINETQTTFLALSSLQLPEIVVFENTALQKKFAELSKNLAK